jgi:SAM-dependent methyltransferase
MALYRELIQQRYGKPGLLAALMKTIGARGVDLGQLNRNDLRTFEEYHLRGRRATVSLAELVGGRPGLRVVDLGCGLGGPARTLAEQCGWIVVGLDLSEAYLEAAAAFSTAVGLSAQTQFELADAQHIPHAADEFDLAWMQHASMNIPDKARLIREIRRVLRAGGAFAFYEIFSQPGAQLTYPLPWADDEQLNFLISAAEFRRRLSSAGFHIVQWQDHTSDLITWGENRLVSRDAGLPNLPELDLVIGDDYPLRSQNLYRALCRQDLQVIQAVFKLGGR